MILQRDRCSYTRQRKITFFCDKKHEKIEKVDSNSQINTAVMNIPSDRCQPNLVWWPGTTQYLFTGIENFIDIYQGSLLNWKILVGLGHCSIS